MEHKIPQVEMVEPVLVQVKLPGLVWRETKAKAALMDRTAQDLVAGCLVMVLDIDAPREGRSS